MIQRIQTVFLFLAIIALALFLYLPLITAETPHFSVDTAGYEVGQSMRIADQPYIILINTILAASAMAVTLIAIFLYKKRSLQMLFVWFAVILVASAAGFVYYKWQTKIFVGDVIYRKWNIMALAAVLFEILAIYFIRKDEETIRSMDRLR